MEQVNLTGARFIREAKVKDEERFFANPKKHSPHSFSPDRNSSKIGANYREGERDWNTGLGQTLLTPVTHFRLCHSKVAPFLALDFSQTHPNLLRKDFLQRERKKLVAKTRE